MSAHSAAAEERFFALSLDLLVVAGFDGHIKRVNPGWERLLGWTDEELLAKPYAEFIHPEDRERTLAEAARLAEPGAEARDFKLRIATRDGIWKWLLLSAQGSPEEQVIFAVGKNITGRNADELTLEQSERRFRSPHPDLGARLRAALLLRPPDATRPGGRGPRRPGDGCSLRACPMW